ncbi:MAG: Hsp20 family protein [Bryobacteraceae bacterium]|nr:Hsp20 family protein [Bryobacteraceae bacterium]
MKLPVKLTRPTTPDTFRSLIHRLDEAMEQIRHRAFEIFEETGKDAHLENWFRAERELFCIPAAEMKETETELQLRIAVPGFAAENLEVSILPEMITVEGEISEKKEEKKEEKTVFSELNERRLFRQFTLPKPIETEDAKAILENGYLNVTARKAKAEPAPTKVPVTAATAAPAVVPEKAMAAANR